MLLEASGDAKWIGTSGFRRIEFSHSLIILLAVYLCVRRWDQDTCLACCFTGSILARSPLTSELCRTALRFFARFHARFPLLSLFLPVYILPSLSLFQSLIRGQRKGFVKLQELFALSSPRDFSPGQCTSQNVCVAIEQLINVLVSRTLLFYHPFRYSCKRHSANTFPYVHTGLEREITV